VRLLVVDDDRALREALRRALELGGYEVRLSETGAGALADVASTVPDAIVLDIGLPDIDGLEVCRALRRDGNRIPVLMLTGPIPATRDRRLPVAYPDLRFRYASDNSRRSSRRGNASTGYAWDASLQRRPAACRGNCQQA